MRSYRLFLHIMGAIFIFLERSIIQGSGALFSTLVV